MQAIGETVTGNTVENCGGHSAIVTNDGISVYQPPFGAKSNGDIEFQKLLWVNRRRKRHLRFHK